MGQLYQMMLHHPGGRYAIVLAAGLLAGTVGFQALAERPRWAYFILIFIALIPLALFLTNRRVVHLFGLLVMGLLMAGVYLADSLQETPQEQVIRISHELTYAVERADYAVFEKHLADNYRWHNLDKAGMMKRVRSSLLPSESRFCGIYSAKVKERGDSPTLTVEGNITANGKYGSIDGFFSGVIELRYERHAGNAYKLVSTKVAWPNGAEVTIPR